MRLYKATQNCVARLKSVFQYEAAFRLELLLAAILVPFAIYIHQTLIELALLVSSLLFVLTAELINTAVESAVNRISLEKHELSKRAKNIGSAVVIVSIFNAATVWLILVL